MRGILAAFCAALLLMAAPALADHPAGATMQDLRDLQYDLELLDDTLASLPAGHRRAPEFQRRADELREDVTWLSAQIRRHQADERQGLGASKADVDSLRMTITTLQADLDRVLDRRYARGVRLPEGTSMVVRLADTLSSKTAMPEQRFEASVAESVIVDDRVVVPVGTRVRGIVTMVEEARRPVKGGKLDVTFDSIWIDDSTRTDLRTRVVSVRPGVDKSETATRAGIGAILGGVLGSILGGKEATIVGAILGAGGGIVASEGEDVNLPAGTLMTLELDEPLAVRASR
jgi:hypothetical protein